MAEPKLVVVSAPSGAGKTTLVHELLKRRPDLNFSVSYTTRPQREAEIHGKDYFFVDAQEFERMRGCGEFLESARVFDHCYGTSRAHVNDLLASGHSVLMEIDWQGARQVRGAAPEAVGIFILPPSRAELERRLRGRGTDSKGVISRRLAEAVADMRHWREFDYVVINEEIDVATGQIAEILRGAGQRFRTDSPEIGAAVLAIIEGRGAG
ncbi:MAG TPA: guanylate kinase [Gammaproteobacteria bacterium]|jgi:guanylate kinase